MFKVFIIVCSLSSPDMCLVGEDSENLYPTAYECAVRANELASAIPILQPGWHVTHYKCEKQPQA